MVHNHAQDPDWVSASITEQTGPVSYNVRMHNTNQIWQRHLDAIWNYSSENASVLILQWTIIHQYLLVIMSNKK